MSAVLERDENMVQLFLDSGADVNAKTQQGDTALTMARQFGESEKRNRLIRKLEAASAKKGRGK